MSRNGKGSELDRAIDELEDAADWEDTTANITVNLPPHPRSKVPERLRWFLALPAWGRVVIPLAFIAAAVATGVAGQILLSLFSK